MFSRGNTNGATASVSGNARRAFRVSSLVASQLSYQDTSLFHTSKTTPPIFILSDVVFEQSNVVVFLRTLSKVNCLLTYHHFSDYL